MKERARKGFGGLVVAVVTVVAGVAGGAAMASEDTFRVTDGVYAGRERTARGAGDAVLLELRGGSFVLMETNRVVVGRTGFAMRGPGGRDGRLNLKGPWHTDGGILRSGGSAKLRKHTGVAALAVWPEERVVLCVTLPGFKGDDVKVPVGQNAPEPLTRCFDLQRMRLSGMPTDDDAPSVPTKPWEGVAGACVEQCVKNNQMRAVGAEVIEADCRAECSR